jgi:hypothetical protein
VKFDEQTNEPAKGQAAVRQCEKTAKDTAAEKVEVSDVQVDGDSATAKAKATGSIFNGQTLDIALVKEGDQWKLDEFKGFEDFDRDAMINAFKTQLSRQGGNTQAINCVVSQFQAASDQEIEAMFTGSDAQAENRFFGPCAKYFQG